MRLANGIVIDKEETFGQLKFSALRREVHLQNEAVPQKKFHYNAEVQLINPVADTVANATFQGEDVDWLVKAEDILMKGKSGQTVENLPNQQSKKDASNRK